MAHFIPRLFCLVVFSGYDTKCLIYENTSIFDCTQEFLVTHPKQWILSWLVTSVLSSIFLGFICDAHKHLNIREKCCNGKFWIMAGPFFPSFMSFVAPITNIDSADMPLLVAILVWCISTVWQIIYLDNLTLVTYPEQCRSYNKNS